MVVGRSVRVSLGHELVKRLIEPQNRRVTENQFAICFDNEGNEASLVLGKIYQVLPDPRAARDDLVRIIDESGEDSLFAKTRFAFVEFPEAVTAKILALQGAR